MTGNGQWSESAEVSTILQSDEAEGDDDQKNCLLMDVPAEKEGGVSTKCHCSYKCLPVGT